MRYPTTVAWGEPKRVQRTFTVELGEHCIRPGVLTVAVMTGDETLHRDEVNAIAKELRELAEVFEQMSCPEDS